MNVVTKSVTDFESWRDAARELAVRQVPPEQVRWLNGNDGQASLDFGKEAQAALESRAAATFRVPRAFVERAKRIACHRDPVRWSLLYRVLWRLQHGEPELLEVSVDEDVQALSIMDKAIERDVHKMHAFVRFDKRTIDAHEEYVAYYRPDHRIVRLAAPFFVERFGSMRWTIMGPEETARWDGKELQFFPDVDRAAVGTGDDLAELWRSYYAATFNPARVNTKLMQREMPTRFWPLLPEAGQIDALVAEAPRRAARLIEVGGARGTTPMSAKAYLPPERNLRSLANAAACCQGCPLYTKATQTVFGEGPAEARIVFVGEQPGDQEDLAGRPFVGLAGQLFDEILQEAGIDRQLAYVTNTVKHFKWEPRGKRRLHSKPDSREIFACRPWLEAELEAIRPAALVLLGATAAQAIFGPQFRITKERGQPRASAWSDWTLATYHPSAILRAAEAAHALQIREAMITDLKLAADYLLRTSRQGNGDGQEEISQEESG